MSRSNIFSGISGAFWGLTFLLIGCSFFVANAGGYNLTRAFLAVMASYSLLGLAYGVWAARNAVMQSKVG
jgi:hypothetical protein